MNHFENKLINSAGAVLELQFNYNIKSTVQDFSKVYALICEQSDFRLNEPFQNAFCFGNKYFFPIPQNMCLCIPFEEGAIDNLKDVFCLSPNASLATQKQYKLIIAGIKKSYKELKEIASGTFDISSIAFESNIIVTIEKL
jgi:hypothetical protein